MIQIDGALLAAGMQPLTAIDMRGQLPLEAVLGPLRRQYQDQVSSGQVSREYLNDPYCSEREFQLGTLLVIGALDERDPLYELVSDEIDAWGYAQYILRCAKAICSYAARLGLDPEQSELDLPSEVREWAAPEERVRMECARCGRLSFVVVLNREWHCQSCAAEFATEYLHRIVGE